MAAHIVRLAGVQPGDRVVEVGPGLGSLTLALCEAGAHVRAVELDHRLADALATVVEGKSVEIVQADALTVDWSELLADGERWIMVSNLPYNVATPVVMGALEHAPMIERFLVMVQREVGERLAAVPGTKAYGAVSVKVAYYARAELVGAVPASVFVPKPKVVSALVRLERRAEPAIPVADPERMFELVRGGFSTRRKMLRRVMSAELGSRTEAILRLAGIDPSARAEELGLGEWGSLAHTVANGAAPECRLDAYAKLTLSLHVVGARPDGYHEIDAFVVSVSEPHDEVILRPAVETSLSVTGPQAAGVPGDELNLASRAAYQLGANVEIELCKGIPVGAGLGGGSADAAAVLVGARASPGSTWTEPTSTASPPSLGADVPFCLRGEGPMRVRGIGDELARVTLPSYAVVIATPTFGCATAAVYRAWDTLGGPVGRPSTSTASRRCATTSNAPRTRSSRGWPRSRCWSNTRRERRRSSRAAARRMPCCSAPTPRPRRRERASPTWSRVRSWSAARSRPGSASDPEHLAGLFALLAARPARLLEKLLVLLLAHALAALLDQGSHGG